MSQRNDPKPTNKEREEGYGLPGEDKGYKSAECFK